ncbi:MAG: hypothetical protein RL625_508 [Gemmatimonadota bacterium]
MHVVFRLVALLLTCTTGIAAQERPADARPARGSSTLWSAVNLYNASATTRATGAYRIESSQRVAGDVAVLVGPVVIAGEVSGTLVAINATVELAASAVIRGDLLILGGTLTRAEGAVVGGEIRAQSEVLRYEIEEGRLVPDEGRWSDWRPSRMRERSVAPAKSYTDLLHFSAGSYNRVEGLPISLGPRLRRTTAWGRVDLDAFGVVRTAGPVAWERGTLGHDAQLAVRLGRDAGLTLGVQAFDLIAPVEAWQVSDQENGLGTFVAHRDLRDYYGRHGMAGSIGGRIGEEVALDLIVGSERWGNVAARDPITVNRAREPWRPNPLMHRGVVDLTTLRLKIDTRERVKAPWLGGWYVQGEIESGRGDLTAPPPPWPTIQVIVPPTPTRYQRAFLDARRRTRLSPGTELSVRIVAGGWIGGDALPMQRRLSIGGPGAVEGYDFRRVPTGEDDVFTCGGVTDEWYGRPALCERMALAQVELRQPIGFKWKLAGDDWRIGVNDRPSWVLFADAGRGWEQGQLPPLSSFRTTLGAGIDFGSFGLYAAKAVSSGSEPMNLLLRVGRRF